MNYLKKEDIIRLNKKTIDKHGGNYVPPSNFLNESALDYLIDIVEHGILFGEEMYPSLESRASLYLFNICQNHIFSDGNKRTALVSLEVFIAKNGHKLKDKLDICIIDEKLIPALPEGRVNNTSILYNLVLGVAEGKISHEEITTWLEKNITKRS